MKGGETGYSWRIIERRETRPVWVGSVQVGGGAPISVQSMTNTPTEDVGATVRQIKELEEAGADIVRVSCPTPESTQALKAIVRAVRVPIVADIHFHYKRAIEAAQAGAACVRINPGNIGSLERVREVVMVLQDTNCSLRIGVNAGSLEPKLLEKYKGPCPQAMVESARNHYEPLEDLGFLAFKISVKASDVFLAIQAYEQLAELVKCPLHLGITEAGGLQAGTVRSSMGMGYLLYKGIGDTIRVSLSAAPVEEVKVGFNLLKTLGLRSRGITIISCPSCARQGFDVIQTVAILEERLSHITLPLTVSIIGCAVNGPGEAKGADIGFTGGGGASGMLYIDGYQLRKLNHDQLIETIIAMVEEKAAALSTPPKTTTASLC